MQLWHYWVY